MKDKSREWEIPLLGRFGSKETGAETTGGFRTMASVLSKSREQSEPERCDFCREEIPPDHRHMADLESRSIMCACRACSLLFFHEGAAGGRYRRIPGRVVDLGPDAQWKEMFEGLGIPVSVVFFFNNSVTDSYVGLYPGPAGATECLLSTDTWKEFSATDERVAGMKPDVEAILIRASMHSFDAFLVPLDLCYELVGRLRVLWRGIDGGGEAKDFVAEYFGMLRQRSETAQRRSDVRA